MNKDAVTKVIDFIERNPETFDMTMLLDFADKSSAHSYLYERESMPEVSNYCIAGAAIYCHQELAQELASLYDGSVSLLGIAADILMIDRETSPALFLGLWQNQQIPMRKITPQMAVEELRRMLENG